MLNELNALMPADIKISKADMPLSKSTMNPKLVEYARRYPALYAKNIHKIRELGEEVAYRSGHSVGLNDMFLGNQKAMDKKLDKIDKLVMKSKPEQAKKILIKSFNDIQKDTIKNEGNSIVVQALSKGRGNPATAARSIGSVVFAVDMNSEPYPFLIKNSLSKGLASHEQYASGGQARYAAVQTAVSTSQPGAMGKVLIANTEGVKISTRDCGTRNGVEERIDSNELIGRYQAGTNKLITARLVSDLKKKGTSRIMVRSAITCIAKKGMCSMCYGKSNSGSNLSVGHNIGIEAGQTVSEKAIQLILSAKHNVAGKVASNIPTGFAAQKILLSPTEKYKGKATISETDGKVDSIEELPIGGYNMVVAGVSHHIGHDVKPKYNAGDTVKKGDQVSTGLASTRDIMKNKGVLEARDFLSRSLYRENGGKISKRNFDVISRGYLNLVKEKGDVSNESLYEFDSFTNGKKAPNTYSVNTSDSQIKNKYLTSAFGANSPGARVTDSILSSAKEFGVKSLDVSHSPMAYEPVFKTYEMKPQSSGSLWKKINFRGINKAIKNDLLFGESENLNKIDSDRAKFALGNL